MKKIKNLDVQDIQQQVDSTKDFIKQTKESVEQVKQAINGVTTLHDGFEGKSANSIRSFFEETHKPFLEFLNSFLIQYEETLSSVYEEVLSFESDEQGFIREEFLEGELKSELVKASTSLTSTSIDINQQLLYVKDIVHIPSIDNDPFIESINKGKEKLKETLSNMYDMDANATKNSSSLCRISSR
ncbi:LXG domain-containing protein [Terribacillus saccharophilus]|uniref:T7SS effector LXG polymorphic toxin n=1 Tax=Terribacillus saccharophilus TaxID=361277 RepID=UPI003982336D